MKKCLVLCLFLGLGLLAACNGGGGGGGGNTLATGILKLSPAQLSIKLGGENNLTLSFTSTAVNQTINVSISSSNSSVAEVNPINTTCVISNAAGINKTCNVRISGKSAGLATITATAPGYTNASATVNVSTNINIVPGNLVFSPDPLNIPTNTSGLIKVTLEHSSGVIDQGFTIDPTANPTIAQISKSSITKCLLSTPTLSNPDQNTCYITIDGKHFGQTKITAVATGANANLYQIISETINVSPLPITPTINFSGNSLTIVPENSSDKFVLNGTGISQTTQVNFSISSPNGSDTNGLSINPPSCELTNQNPSCAIEVGSFGTSGNYTITASANGIVPAQSFVEVDPVSYTGKLSLISQSPQSIVVGSGVSIPVGAWVEKYTGNSFQVSLNENNDGVILSAPPGASNNVNCFKIKSNGDHNSRYSCTCTYPLATYGSNPAGNCSVYASGLYAGDTVITASTPPNPGGMPYTNPTSLSEIIHVLPATTSVYGKLDFSSKIMNVISNSNVSAMLDLFSSQNVNGLNVNISSSNPDIISASAPDCTKMSTANNNSCNVSITAKSKSGSAVITASDAAGNVLPGSMVVNIGTNGALISDPAKVILLNPAPYPGGGEAKTVTIKLVNSQGMNNVRYNVASENQSTANISPGTFIFSSTGQSSKQILTINPTILVGSTFIDITPQDPTQGYPTIRIPIQTMTPSQQARHFTFVNKCSYPVWFAFSGGAVSGKLHSPAECPPNNSTFVQSADAGDGLCFWNNPSQPAKGYKLNSYSDGDPDKTTVELPTLSGLEVQWSGTLTARTGCDGNGNCDYSGSCPIVGNGDMSCKPGKGFNPPSTLGELTLDTAGLDFYDVTLITGITVPMSFGPTNNIGFGEGNSNSPYFCGTAGSIVAQTVQGNTLGAANWLKPTPPALSGTNNIPPQIYNIVDAVVPSQSCGPTNGYACSSGLACGHTIDTLQQGSSTLNYTKWTCGTLIAQASADGLYKLNPTTTNTLPFNFFGTDKSPGQNGNGTNSLNLPNEKFFECPASDNNVSPPVIGLDSAYQPLTPENGDQTCGYETWGMTYQSGNFQAYSAANQTWIDQVLPTITWIKQTCPTCYTYPYDDPTSTFTCHNNTTKLNSANGTDYTVTFCPNN